MSYNPSHKSFDLPVRCSEHRREHCSCSVEQRKTHSLFTIKYSTEVIQGFNRGEHKCWFNSSLTPKFSGRCERAAYEYLMQESHIPPSHMKKVYEKWVWVAAPGWILNHQYWSSIPIYISFEAYSRWHLIRLSAGSRKANLEGGIELVLNSYSEPNIRDIHLWPVEFWENHRFSPETWKLLFNMYVRHLFLSCSISRYKYISHCQLIWLPEGPNSVARERD